MRLRRGMVLVAASVLVACSGDGGAGGTTVPPTSSSSAPASTAPAIEGDAVVRAYVDALAAGDVAAANRLRCAAGRMPEASLDRFGTAASGLLQAAGGELSVGEVRVVDPITLADLSGQEPLQQVAFSLRTKIAGLTDMVSVAIVQEEGRAVLCGSMQEGAPAVQQQVASTAFPPFIGRLDDLRGSIPSLDATVATQLDDRRITELADVPGATDGWTRAWALKDGTGLRITAYRTAGSEVATQLARASLASAGLDAVEFLGDLHGGFVGVSVVSEAWTWAHPASIGLRNQLAAAVVGDIAMVVELTGTPPTAGTGPLDAVLDTFGFG